MIEAVNPIVGATAPRHPLSDSCAESLPTPPSERLASLIRVYTQPAIAQAWLRRCVGRSPHLACVLGFTETGLIPGISAAGATPDDRRWTAIADAEFLACGVQPHPRFPLPPLAAGASPVLISRAVVAQLGIPVTLLNAGLPHPPTVPHVDLGGTPARCLSSGQALPLATVQHLLTQGIAWGQRWIAQAPADYLILGECVVGGTTTALAVLTALGWSVQGMVNSSHPTCNHSQKWAIVQAGLTQAGLTKEQWTSQKPPDPLAVVAAVGDPMQIVVAGMAIAASAQVPVLLAGGTQMLAVYALMQALRSYAGLDWPTEAVAVGTTRWVAADPTGDTVGLAALLQAPLLATALSFATAQAPQLQAYEQGFVKEGVGAGGCAIAAHLQGWSIPTLVEAVNTLLQQRYTLESPRPVNGTGALQADDSKPDAS